MKLDFKDLYQSGLSFDRFEAAINIADGLARTSEPMDLRGPTARMRLSGESDLRRNLIDADLVVSLPLGSNLPWVAGLAGRAGWPGPPREPLNYFISNLQGRSKLRLPLGF